MAQSTNDTSHVDQGHGIVYDQCCNSLWLYVFCEILIDPNY